MPFGNAKTFAAQQLAQLLPKINLSDLYNKLGPQQAELIKYILEILNLIIH